MRSSIGASTRNRVLVIIGVIALCLWAVYPIQKSLKLGLDLNGGVQLVLRVKTEDPRIAPERHEEVVEQAMRTIERRVNELGVTESVIQRYTAADQILVELPGVSDVERAKQVIKSTAQLRLTLVDRGPFASRDAALLAYHNAPPQELEILEGKFDSLQPDDRAFYAVHRTPAITGADLRNARQVLDEFNRPAVGFTLNPDAAGRFGVFTEANINRPLATVLDNRVVSVATIQSRIDDSGQISGVSRDEMVEQVINLNSGALPADLEYVEERTIGASLGAASIRDGVLASFGGLGLVLLFMLSYYRLTGVNAVISVVLNLLILLALMALIPVTLTLPGIAGLILTIGMGVDSNVLIFERIKEELAAAQSSRAAIKAAFTRVWLTIVDTHVTSLIAAALLFQYGTTSIRGFATTLAIGLLANVFTAVFVSRTVFEVAHLRQGYGGQALSSKLSIGGWQLFANTRINFTRWRTETHRLPHRIKRRQPRQSRKKKTLTVDFPLAEVPFPISNGAAVAVKIEPKAEIVEKLVESVEEIPPQNDFPPEDFPPFDESYINETNPFEPEAAPTQTQTFIENAARMIEAMPLKFPPISSEDLEHIEDSWLDDAYERKLQGLGDDLKPILTASNIVEILLAESRENNLTAKIETTNGAAAAPARIKTNFVIPTFEEESNEIPVMPENPTEEQMWEYAQNHPLVKKALRIFRGKLIEVRRV